MESTNKGRCNGGGRPAQCRKSPAPLEARMIKEEFEEFEIRGKEEEEEEEVAWEKEARTDLLVKEECAIEDISLVVVPETTEPGLTGKWSQTMMSPLEQTEQGVKAEPDGCGISRYGNDLMGEEGEEPMGHALKEEPEVVTWDTSSLCDVLEQETGNGDDPFLLKALEENKSVVNPAATRLAKNRTGTESSGEGSGRGPSGRGPSDGPGDLASRTQLPAALTEGDHVPDLTYPGGSVEPCPAVFPCARCPVSFTVELYLHRHLKRSHPEDHARLLRARSSRPSPSNTPPSQAVAATTPTTPAKAHACPHCGKGFARPGDLKVHQRRHTGERPFPCAQCGRRFACADVLRRHRRTHTGEKPHRCPQCGKGFGAPYNLRRHQRTHSGQRPHRCPECPKAFGRAEDLHKHRQTHAPQTHRCPQCARAFSRAETLRAHLRAHAGERPHRCAQCGKSFGFSRDLRKHQVTHTGERPHRCPQCGKSFGRVWDLTVHGRSHSGERPYHCSQCGQSFGLIGNFRRHLLTHSGERTFRCAQCQRSFARAAHLKQHLQTHTQERRHQCPRCGKSFNHLGNFQRHQRSHPT